MPEPQYTRCPACKTVFRVTVDQLAMREGRVRCGHCKTVFDGRAEIVRLGDVPSPREPAYDDVAHGPPTMTLRMAQGGSVDMDTPPAIAPGEAPRLAPAATAGAAPNLGSGDRRQFSWVRNELRPKRRLRAFYAVAIPVLLLLLVGQVVLHFRSVIAAWQPAARPALVRACQLLRCSVDPVRDIASLSIDGSDLQADPAHRGLLMLSATIRNRSRWPLAYPYLELTLTDARDAVVARRALPPPEYAAGTADLAHGIAPNTDVPVKLFVDASATTQAGYRLYLFYP